MSPVALDRAAIDTALAELPDWQVVDGKLHREYAFPDFVHAFRFMSAVALIAEARNHHPEWFNVYGRVIVDLTTHDAGGISQADLDLAATMETLTG
ncbi:MAG: 4a-hydroxytetrahydrobiopterin dehydratase [Myxococcota bacterium]